MKSELIYSLLKRYKLLDLFDYVIEKPNCLSIDFAQFHSQDYLNILLNEDHNSVMPFDEEEAKWAHLKDISRDWTENSFNNADKYDTNDQWFEERVDLFNYYKSLTVSGLKNRKRSALEALLIDYEPENGDNSTEKEYKKEKARLKEFNLEGDCPIFSFLPMYCHVITGASLMLVDYMQKDSIERTIAINWDGGRHHALKRKASGFCYINDIVLVIQKLRKKGFNKVSYLDFDLHHGDGVEKAFQYSSNIQTISMHMYETGFFPCSGSLEDAKRGKNIVNIPLLHGVDDEYLKRITSDIVIPLSEKHSPDAILIQCGGDGLIGDGFAEWQLTIHGLTACIMNVINNFPQCSIVLVGGGGYNELVMSRFYTFLTFNILQTYAKEKPPMDLFGHHEDEDVLIPEHEFIELYSKEYYNYWIYEKEGSQKRKNLKNDNSLEYIKTLQNFYKL